MKKTFLLASSLLFLLSACKKKSASQPDPEPAPVTNTTGSSVSVSLSGTWNWVELYQLPDGNTSPAPSYSIACPTGKQITFTANSYSASWTYPLMGRPPATNSDNGSYTTGDSLILNSATTPKTARGKVYRLTTGELWYRYVIYDGSVYEVRFVKQ